MGEKMVFSIGHKSFRGKIIVMAKTMNEAISKFINMYKSYGDIDESGITEIGLI